MGLRIVYVAKHDQPNSADDEGAITHTLTELGHRVERVREVKGRLGFRLPADLLLFHKWHDPDGIDKYHCPKIFWYFDLVAYPDYSLHERCKTRINWMLDVTPHVDIGFCTDGDWVANDPSGKLVWLPQGADGRIVGVGRRREKLDTSILFTGVKRGGEARSSFVVDMEANYGSLFRHIQQGAYREELADLIASSKIVVAPDGPVTSRYWSNRVYNTLGFGGFLLHPYCELLAEQYKDGEHLVYYRSRVELYDKIRYYWDKPKERNRIAQAGLAHTKRFHLYKHRCEQLIRTVKDWLNL